MVIRLGHSIDEILAAARRRLDRLDPVAVLAAMADGAVLVDIRPQAQRTEEGAVPGALIVERNVLEWRFDPRSAARLPVASGFDLVVIVMCSQGYTSSVASRPRPAQRDRPRRRLRRLGTRWPAHPVGRCYLVTACLTRRRPKSHIRPEPRCASSITSVNASTKCFASASPIVSGGSSLITSM